MSLPHLTIVTGWGPAGYKQYGRRFCETFDAFMPKGIDLVVYGEEPVSLPRDGEFRELTDIPGLPEFLARHDNDVGRGRKPAEGRLRYWKESQLAAGYSFKFDAWKFCRQGFIPHHAAETILNETPPYAGDRLLAWFDADVVFHRPVPRGTIEHLLPDWADVAYLGRGAKHSEIGFQLYRLPAALPMLEIFSRLYESDEVFSLGEWHSAYCFDEARRRSGIRGHDITPGGHGHVWHQSPLREFSDHLKGDKRKQKGRSDERR